MFSRVYGVVVIEAERTLVGARAVNERLWISNEEYFGMVTFCAQILLLKMNPFHHPHIAVGGSGKY